MSKEPVKVLLVEDNSDYAWMLRLVLTQVYPEQFELDQAENLQLAFQHLSAKPYDVLLLDLSLPDSQGYDTFLQTRQAVPDLPIVVMTAVDEKRAGRRAARDGAHDFLVKGDMDVVQLVRSIQYAVERQRTVADLKRISLVDDHTGLLNRSGFLSLAEQHIKIARRAGRSLLLFYADLDNLKQVNDRHGLPAGDHALQVIADLLRRTFRSSDLVARFGGDEFTVLAIDAPPGSAGIMLNRLQERISQHNTQNATYQISLSVGTAQLDSEDSIDIHALLAKAEKSLHAAKRNPNASQPA